MARERIRPGSVGPVSVFLLGVEVGDESQTEVTIPNPVTDSGEQLPWPKTAKVGASLKIATSDGVREYMPTRWHGITRAWDIDGSRHLVRRWRTTKAAADSATRQAAQDKLVELARVREAQVRAAEAELEAEAVQAQGDVQTTVADLVDQYLASPRFARLAGKTQQDYRYAADRVKAHVIGGRLPRDVDVAVVRQFLADMAANHGSAGAKHSRAVLRSALDLAIGVKALKVASNAVLGAHASIPRNVKRKTSIDHRRAPTDREVKELLSGLTRDPQARAMYPGGPRRRKSRHGHAGAVVNGRDIADLSAVMFATGARIGEVAALRWSDFDPHRKTISISGTLVTVAGKGTHRQPSTKTAGSTRVVPLSPWAVAALSRRARRFGVSMIDPPGSPIFGSPQFPDRWRDQGNLNKAVKVLYARHGLDWARGHAARKWRVTSLAERGVPTHKIADLVGHESIATTLGYLGRRRQTDDDVVAAL
jgi:integrase